MALNKPCTLATAPLNTGTECNASMGPTAMLIFAPKAAKWTAENEANFETYVETMLHAPLGLRWYIIFGQAAPIRTINNGKESDVIETLDDGSMHLIRKGMYSRTFLTDDGGDCLSKILISMESVQSKYGFIEFDNALNVRRRVNVDNTFSPFPTNLAYAPNPELPDFKTSFKNAFMMNFNALYYIKQGAIATSDVDMTGMMGLLDTDVLPGTTPPVATGATAATGTVTVVKGATGDTINIKVGGTTISGLVTQEAAESTDTLLAAKIVAQINSLTAINGGYSATNIAGAITISGSTALGASLNTTLATATITGTIAATIVAFSGGISAVTNIYVQVQTECAETDLVALLGTQLANPDNFVVTKVSDGSSAAISAALEIAPSGNTPGQIKLTGTFTSGQSYKVALAPAATLLANSVSGYEGIKAATIAIP